MAGVGEEAGGVDEEEYESDPEEAKMSLKMRRRREASDDEEEEAQEDEEVKPSLRRMGSEGESEGEGAAPEYDDDEEELEEEELEIEEGLEDEYLEDEGEVYEEERSRAGGEGKGGVAVGAEIVSTLEGVEERKEGNENQRVDVQDVVHDDNFDSANNNDNQQQRGLEEKKENEPYAVPTAGAFYMHDDRFRDNAGGRHRRTLGGRKLWESKDDRKWGHDKFEELKKQDRHYDEGRRTSRGRYRGRGKNRADQGFPRGSKGKAYNNNQDDHNSQNMAPKGVRGRGPRRYQPSFKNNNDTASVQERQSVKSVEKPSHASSGRVSAQASTAGSDAVPPRKHVASNLNIASPPFYPSGSTSKEITLTQKKDVQSGAVNRNIQTSVVDKNFSVAQSNALLRGKNVVDSVGMDKLYIDDSVGKPSSTLQAPPSSSPLMNSQSQQFRSQGRGISTSVQMGYQPAAPNNQANRVSLPTQPYNGQRGPVQSGIHPSLQGSGQQFAQRLGGGSQSSSPPKAASNSSEPGEMESLSESGKSKSALVGKGKGSVQGSGRGFFIYGGPQVMGASGNMGSGNGDQNFPGTPAFLPVMQFGGQHPGGIGVPAVGMAFPGYVAQPQLGVGNSEMTWLPVLAGAAGALGATYGSPYISVDGSYNNRTSGQSALPAAASSKENPNNKPNNEWKPLQRPENDDLVQRQKNPRRYTEMKFDQ